MNQKPKTQAKINENHVGTLQVAPNLICLAKGHCERETGGFKLFDGHIVIDTCKWCGQVDVYFYGGYYEASLSKQEYGKRLRQKLPLTVDTNFEFKDGWA